MSKRSTISRLRAGLISSAAIALLAVSAARGGEIRSVRFSTKGELSVSLLSGGSLLKEGTALSDSLLDLEILRIDSLCFSRGRLAAEVGVDTLSIEGGVDILIEIDEGEWTKIGSIAVTGSSAVSPAETAELLRLKEGDRFLPVDLGDALVRLLEYYNKSGYPFAQVWLTGFEYDIGENEVDLAVSIFEGETSVISNVSFRGLTGTDSTFALRLSRLRIGSRYDEQSVSRGREYLQSSGVFRRVDEPSVEQAGRGDVEVVYTVEELGRNNLFQGGFGISQKDGEDYVLSGAVDLVLRNIAGRGRNAHLSWINNGESYSRLEMAYSEPFLFSSPMGLEAQIRQIVQDSVYVYHSAGLIFSYPLGPRFAVKGGASVDRNVPDQGELVRSVRQRYRLGVAKSSGSRFNLELHVEGAYKRSYLEGNRSETDRQILYRLEGDLRIPLFYGTGIFWRVVSESVFSSKEIHSAETYPLGGATSLRGYRESQFRGERIAYTNIEYWFGEEGALYLFDDIGAFYRSDDGWKVKNGLGFGLRSSSPVGVVALSFGLGDQVSLRGTRIHISLSERF
jgi:outer membrane protein assembly factor BamA